jgi:ATP-dependent 26S proteasome regulatory subunit
MPVSDDLNLAYLENELTWINLLVHKCVLRWELAGQDFNDQFRGLRIDITETEAIADQPLWSNWGAAGGLSEAQELRFHKQEKLIKERRQDILKLAVEQHTRLRLPVLTDELGLSNFEYRAFLVCLVSSLDLRYERLFGFLQNDITRKSPGVNLILDILLSPGIERLSALECFSEQAPLCRLGLIHPIQNEYASRPILNREFMAAPEVVSWIVGQSNPAVTVDNSLQLLLPPFENLPFLNEPAFASVNWAAIIKERAHLSLSGADPHRQLFAAQWIAERLGNPLLVIDVAGLKNSGRLDSALLRMALRDCVLIQAIPLFSGWDAFLDADPSLQSAIMDEIAWFPGPVITQSATPWNAALVSTRDPRPIYRWNFNLPVFGERRGLWLYYLGEDGKLPEADLDLLAGQFILTSAQIQAAVHAARNLALQQQRPLKPADLLAAARQQTSSQLDNLAVKIKPRYTWQDVVLPEEELTVLHEIVATIRGRARVLDEWGLGKKLVPNPGIAVLFAGPPGTGKTLSAQVIAAELGLDIYRIDLSTVVSKYIGETEKNLEQIFSQAANSNAILFFDEADAIFGKRSEVKDAHDRYANIEVSYLLQRIENFDGVVILASNLRSNLDEAFVRRLQFIIDFPFPDEAQRLSIWKVLFPPGVPRAEALDFENLAKRFSFSGGNIRNVIVNAAFAAASEDNGVSNQHLMHAVRREMQKMGRLINEKELSL